MPNATTVVYLHDEPNGGVSITTGDFVEYFNRRYGGKDRIGAVRRSLEQSGRRAELRGEAGRAVRETRISEKRTNRSFGASVRTASARLKLLHAMFVLMLMLSVSMLICSSLALKKADSNVRTLESEIAVLENTHSGQAWLASYDAAPADVTYPAMDGGDEVEVYTPENEGVNGFLLFWNALLSLGK